MEDGRDGLQNNKETMKGKKKYFGYCSMVNVADNSWVKY